jgi:hypothetical protein
MMKIFLVMVVLSIATPIHLYAQTPLRYDALLCQSTDNNFINKNSYSIDPVTLGIRQKKRGKLFLTIASSMAAGGILLLAVGAVLPPNSDAPYYLDSKSILLVGGTVVIAGGIGLSIPGMHLWKKGQKNINSHNSNQ